MEASESGDGDMGLACRADMLGCRGDALASEDAGDGLGFPFASMRRAAR